MQTRLQHETRRKNVIQHLFCGIYLEEVKGKWQGNISTALWLPFFSLCSSLCSRSNKASLIWTNIWLILKHISSHSNPNHGQTNNKLSHERRDEGFHCLSERNAHFLFLHANKSLRNWKASEHGRWILRDIASEFAELIIMHTITETYHTVFKMSWFSTAYAKKLHSI